MKNILVKIGSINRRIIFILIALSVLIPLLKPDWFNFPIKIDRNTETAFNSISDLSENDKVLVSFEYGASTKPEVHPMAVALLKHLFAKGIKVYIVSLWPEGPIMAQQAMEEVLGTKLFNIKDGSDYVMFDYKTGGAVVIKNIAEDFRGIYKQDYNGVSIENMSIMEGVYSVSDFDFVFDFSAGVPGNAEWVQYACDPKNIPLSSGCTSIMVTDAIPYVESGQLQGIIAGMPGAAEYEKMVYDFLSKTQNENKFIINDQSIIPGKVLQYLSAQSVAHVLMVIFIILGNVSYYYSRRIKS